jgi:hypothetical protein
MDPILYRAEPDGRLTPLMAHHMCRVRVAGAWLSISAAGLMERVSAGTLGSDHLVSGRYLRPYRPEAEAPYGWAEAVFGHDAQGRPCALILPAPAPPPPTIEALREAALADLLEERHRRVDLYTGADARARDNRLMAAIGIVDRVQSGTATPEDLELMEALRQVEPLVRAHDAAAAAIRAEILAAESPEAMDAIMAGLATDPRWPT